LIDEDLAKRAHPYLAPAGKSFDEMPEKEQDALRVHCEIAKCHLATDRETNISVHYGGAFQALPISRDFCRPVIEPRVCGAIDLLARTIKHAGLSVDAVEEIIVIGGSSRLWLLREMIQNDPGFAGIARFPKEPEWDVAKGAAVIDRHPGTKRRIRRLRKPVGSRTRLSRGCPLPPFRRLGSGFPRSSRPPTL
jgi:molecular chaperone DnaK